MAKSTIIPDPGGRPPSFPPPLRVGLTDTPGATNLPPPSGPPPVIDKTGRILPPGWTLAPNGRTAIPPGPGFQPGGNQPAPPSPSPTPKASPPGSGQPVPPGGKAPAGQPTAPTKGAKKPPRVVPKAPGPVIPTVPQYLPKVTFGPPIFPGSVGGGGGSGGGMAAPTAPDLSKYGGGGGPSTDAPQQFVAEPGVDMPGSGRQPQGGGKGYLANNGAYVGPDGTVSGGGTIGEPVLQGQSTGPLGQYGPGQDSPLVQQTQQAMDEAKKANEDRYKEILAGYGQREARGKQLLDEAEQGALTDIEDSARIAAGKVDQNLTSRGLGNTTIRESSLRGVETARVLAREKARASLAERRLGAEAGLTGDRLQFMERRNDTGPDLQAIQQLYGQMGLAGYGQPAPQQQQPNRQQQAAASRRAIMDGDPRLSQLAPDMENGRKPQPWDYRV